MNSEYWRLFGNEKPEKQAKSYEIDLGQTVSNIFIKNGAYKEELLFRYGDHTINKMLNKLDNKSHVNIEEIIKMNDELKPFQEREKEYKEKNFIKQCDSIEFKIYRLEELTKEIKLKENEINNSIESMTNEVFKYFDENYNEFEPKLKTKYKYLKTNIKEQKDENANLVKQIDLLKQDLKSTTESIDKLKERLAALENITGLEYNENYDEDDRIVSESVEKNFFVK